MFDDAQDVWAGTFARGDQAYDRAQLVLYSGAVQTDGCGGATSAVGQFYCPADERVYLDLGFHADMKRQLGAPGDFAWAYVIAHEMGHHVQRLTGTSSEVDRLSGADPGEANGLSVRQELQADCYAGVWASTVYAAGDLEAGDIDEAFTAAEAVGDDRLQQQAGARVDPRQLHPRHLRAAAPLVRAWLRLRRPRRMQHVRGRAALAGRRHRPAQPDAQRGAAPGSQRGAAPGSQPGVVYSGNIR